MWRRSPDVVMAGSLQRRGRRGLDWFAHRGWRMWPRFESDNPAEMPLRPRVSSYHLLADAEFSTQVVEAGRACRAGRRGGRARRGARRDRIQPISPTSVPPRSPDGPPAPPRRQHCRARLRLRLFSDEPRPLPDSLPLHLVPQGGGPASTPPASCNDRQSPSPSSSNASSSIDAVPPSGVLTMEIEAAESFAPLPKIHSGAAADAPEHVQAALRPRPTGGVLRRALPWPTDIVIELKLRRVFTAADIRQRIPSRPHRRSPWCRADTLRTATGRRPAGTRARAQK